LKDLQVVDGGMYSEIIELGKARCSELHSKLIYLLPFGGIITGIRVNETINYSQTTAGFIDKEGNCKGTSFTN